MSLEFEIECLQRKNYRLEKKLNTQTKLIVVILFVCFIVTMSFLSVKQDLNNELEQCYQHIEEQQQIIDSLKQPQIETPKPKPTLKSLGTFTAFAYCKENYPHICNNGNAASTATGTTPTAGRTIAVDPNIIPLGAKVIIDGHTYIAEDTGGAIKGKRIDIVHNTHQEALQFGKRQVEVFMEVA